jgi:hypothetical protein
MPNPAIHNAIEELLLRDQFACIPNLGGFLLKASSPTVNGYTQELKPTHSLLVFNAQLQNNDGQLAHLLSVSTGLSYKDALIQIDSFVADIRLQLNKKRYATFFPFGNFFHNEHKGIFFVPRQQFNLHLPNFGLQPLKWNSTIQKAARNSSGAIPQEVNTLEIPFSSTHSFGIPEDAQVMSVSSEHIAQSELQSHTNIWWKVAAGFAIVSVSALTLSISLMTWMGAYQERQQYANLTPALPTLSQTTAENNSASTQSNDLKETDIVYINGKLIRMNKPTENNTAPTQTEVPSNATIEKNTNAVEAVSTDNSDVKAITFHSSSDFHEHLLNTEGSYFLVGGSYLTTKAAEIECQQWFLNGTPATVFKPVKSSFHKIVLGRFKTKEEVQAYSVTIDMIPGANLSMFRWDLR